MIYNFAAEDHIFLKQEFFILLLKDRQPVNSLEDYVKQGGLKGLVKARSMSPLDVVAEVKKANLRGRGGAGFPAGIKWESVIYDECRAKYVVCNSAEGEPGTYKDRYLLSKNPYFMLEGLLIISHAIGAEAAYIGIKKKFTVPVNRIKSAIDELEKAKIVEQDFIHVVLGPDDYLFGEEKALLEVIDGRGAMPRIMPPYMQGVGFTPLSHNPTVVNNVETMSNLPQILANGADWYLQHGPQNCPGTMIMTLSGDVKKPGMYEVPMGTKLSTLLYEYGGGPVSTHPLKAVFSGVANCVITPRIFDTPLDFDSMRKAGSGLGSGGFIVYDASMCMVKVAQMLSNFLAMSSCGQCLPCSKGTRTITNFLDQLEGPRGGSQDDLEGIRYECGCVTNQTRCFLPTQESKMIASILKEFSSEFDVHTSHPCSFSREPILPKLEYYDEEKREFRYEGQLVS
jgi:NADH:ubiquinone oxidoreductase subunit F (NADH-binding)